MEKFIAVTALLSLTLAAHVNHAQARTVCASGCDFTSIQAAIDYGAGDPYDPFVTVLPGIYYENITIPAGTSIIKIESQSGPESTIIDGGGAGTVVTITGVSPSDLEIIGFTIRNGHALMGGGIHSSTNEWAAIRNCIITNNTADNAGGGVYLDGKLVITDSVIADNLSDIDGGGIYFEGFPGSLNDLMGRDITISGNTAASGSGGGIYANNSLSLTESIISGNTATSGLGGGIRLSDDTGIIAGGWMFKQCTISDNIAGSVLGGDGIAATADINFDLYILLLNSIIWGNGTDDIYFDTYVAIDSAHSDIRGGWAGSGYGNIDCDPLFVGPGNYYLQSGSCCIDSGTDSGVLTDIEGTPRPLGAGWDIGAYEWFNCTDADGDFFATDGGACGPVDCNDTNPAVNPGAAEVCANGIDDDCDGLTDCDDTDCDSFCGPQPEVCDDGIDRRKNRLR